MKGRTMSKSLQKKRGIVVSKSGDKTVKYRLKPENVIRSTKKLLMLLGLHLFMMKKMQ